MRQPLSVSAEKLDEIAQRQSEKQSQGATAAVKSKAKGSLSVSPLAKEGKWAVPVFPSNVNLLAEKNRAFVEAQKFMDSLLNDDDMRVELEQTDADIPTGHVINLHTGDVINSYSAMDILKVYAQNNKPRGLIVDGNV